MTEKETELPTKLLSGQVDDLALLLSAVEQLLGEQLVPKLPEYEKYHARVAKNSLAIARRQIEASNHFKALDEAYLPRFGLERDSDVGTLSAKIVSGEVELKAELMDYLKCRTLLQLEIDNPSYWGCDMAREQWSESLARTASSKLK